jgi:hypothetical protein
VDLLFLRTVGRTNAGISPNRQGCLSVILLKRRNLNHPEKNHPWAQQNRCLDFKFCRPDHYRLLLTVVDKSTRRKDAHNWHFLLLHNERAKDTACEQNQQSLIAKKNETSHYNGIELN